MSGIIGGAGSKSGVIGLSGSGLQSSFNVKLSGEQTDIASGATVAFNTLKASNIGGDFNTSTYKYTAPITGMYSFFINVYSMNIANDHNYYRPLLLTDNNEYGGSLIDTRVWDTSAWLFGQNICTVTDMDAGDTAYVYINYAGSSGTDINHNSFFSGYFTGITY